MQPSMMQGLAQPPAELAPVKPYHHETMSYGDRGRDQDPGPMPPGYPAQPPPPVFDDYNLFLDDYATSSHFLPNSLEAEQGFAFPSRFPSLAPDMRDPSGDNSRVHEDGTRAPNWRISAMDHTVIRNRLDEFSSALPNDFVFPSRHTLNRFLEGYISGFHDNLPFLHLPTLSPTELSPELLLAMLAVGAQYRFETNRGHALWYAAKTSRLETIQALLLLFAVGLWGAKAILHEALSLQSLLALLLREEGLVAEAHQQTVDWEAWVRLESSNRTKLVAYCFFNLCSIAYNTPPLLLTSEVHLYLPNASRLWKAENAWQWQEARQSYPNIEISLQEAVGRLLSRPSQPPPTPLTSLGNYILIHALIQHIFLLKQTSFSTMSPFGIQRGLNMDDVEAINQALRAWSLSFEQHRQQRASEMAGAGEGYVEGAVAFNSTALLRLAYIRLHTDLSPSRSLETRDHVMIAQAFSDAPLLVRSPLCNLECAVLLSKWLLSLSAIGPAEPPPSAEERNLLEMVRRMLDETEFAVPIDPSLASAPSSSSGSHGHHQSRSVDAATDSTKLRQLACAVIRLWAETFKGVHIFDIVRIIAAGLEGYADLMEKPRDRTPLGGGGEWWGWGEIC
ncbi:hypothetical protein N0V88_005480 [Collariella sp. IMI 366227]|nr:hypothetical protein N0V88_005480 [Collariella sp. IMI 366227]